MRAGDEVLVVVDDNCTLIVGNPQGILGWLLRVLLIHLSNIIIIIIVVVVVVVVVVINITKLKEGKGKVSHVF